MERDFQSDSGFAILKEEFNRQMEAICPGLAVNLGLPEKSQSAPSSDVFWVFWETSRLPKEAAKQLKKYRQIWVPSRWLHQVLLESDVGNKVVHIARDSRLFALDATTKDPTVFRFLWVNDWIHRKGGDLMLEAFLRAFSKDDQVELIIKPTYTNRYCKRRFLSIEDELRKLDGTAKSKVRVVDSFISVSELASLYKSSDCYVYPLRTQGASLTIIEAQLCELPCIVTNYGGCTDYVDGSSSYLVNPVSFEPLTKVDFFSDYKEDLGIQAVLDLRDLSETMRYCFEHRDEVAEKGRRARIFAERNLNWESTQKEIESVNAKGTTLSGAS